MLAPELAAGPNWSSLLVCRHADRVAELRAAFEDASPWKHVVIDDFLPSAMAEEAAAQFPKAGRIRKLLGRLFEARSYDGAFQSARPRDIPMMRALTEALDSADFTALVESITGFSGLKLDSGFAGAGFHLGVNGSYLRVHADHNAHPANPSRYRRVNLMLYLNEFWQTEWNGDLELWDRKATECRKRIEPLFNRCVIMSVDDSTFHGYGPLRMPAAYDRRVLAAYYYADTPAPGQASEPHGTLLPSVSGEKSLAAVKHRVLREILARVEKALLLFCR